MARQNYTVEVHYHSMSEDFQPSVAHVANVTVEAETPEDAMEMAFRRTQNIDGSWSRGELIESLSRNGSLEDNADYFAGTTVLVPLPVNRAGKTMGLRSSMTGDRFVVDGKAYRVASFGFDLIEEA